MDAPKTETWWGWAASLRPADRWLLAVLGLSVAVYTSWLAFHWGPAVWQPVLANVLSDLPTVLAVAFAWRGVLEHRASRRWGWVSIGLGISAAALGDLLWALQELVLFTDPFPSIADLFYLLFIPFFLIGFYFLARAPLVRRSSVRLDLDALILISAGAVVSWYIFFAPLISDSSGSRLDLLVSLAYPALDLVLFSLMVLVVLRPDGWTGPGSILFMLGLLCFLAADVAYTLLVAASVYTTGHPIDVLWVLSTVLFALAVWADRSYSEDTSSAKSPVTSWTLYLPYAAIAVCYALLLLSHPNAGREAVLAYTGVLFGTTFVTCLVVWRQVLTLRDNQKLSRALRSQNDRLEERVQARTHELKQTNGELLELSQTLEQKVQERTSELEASRLKLAHQARHDILTGLPNRAALEEQLHLAVSLVTQEDRSLCLFFIDLDGFKQVNDTFGHDVGDNLLREVAVRLRRSLRHGDVVARLGGDEFVVLLPALEHPHHAERLASKLLEMLKEPFVIDERVITIGASIGVSLLPQDAADMAALQRHADIAMYQAKNSGKNSVRFYAESLRSAQGAG